MAHLKKKRFTKPIPAGATIVKVRGVPSARYKDASGKTVTAPLTADGTPIRLLSAKWYAVFSKSEGGGPPVPLFTDQTASLARLAELVRKREHGESGIADPFERHRRRPLVEHIADWRASLANSGAGDKHANQFVGCVRRLVEICKFTVTADISASRVQQYLADLRADGKPTGTISPAKEWYTRRELACLLGVKPSAITSLVRRHRLADGTQGNGKRKRYSQAVAEALLGMRARGASIRTSNAHLAAAKQFCRWLVADRRILSSPLEHLSGGNVKHDRRHDRRILDAKELKLIIAAAGESDVVFRGITGRDRQMIYMLAASTGFRVSELAVLTPRNFNLDSDCPEVTISGVFTKNGKEAIQPIPVEVSEAMQVYLASRPAGDLLWPGTWHERAADMFRIDLDACGIPYVVDGPNGPLYADAHSLRHSFVALLDRAGATLKEAMQLARHSDPKPTMSIYGRARQQDLSGAVDRLPTLLDNSPQSEQLRATGTDGASLACRLACRPTETRGDTERRQDNSDVADISDGDKPDSDKGFATVGDAVRRDEISASCRARTYDPLIKSQKNHQKTWTF